MEQFDKYINERMVDVDIQPPAGFWHNISDALDQQENIATFQPAPKSSLARLLRVAAVFLGLFSLGTLSYLNNRSETDLPITSFDMSSTTESIPTSSKEQITTAVEIATTLASVNTAKIQAQPKVENRIDETVDAVYSTDVIAEAHSHDNSSDHVAEFNLQETNIPVYSLKLLSKKVPSNDEITVIENNTSTTAKPVNTAKPSKKAPLPWRY